MIADWRQNQRIMDSIVTAFAQVDVDPCSPSGERRLLLAWAAGPHVRHMHPDARAEMIAQMAMMLLI